MHAYGIDLNSRTFSYSYLKNRKQNVKVNNACSIFQILLSGAPQGSILAPILSNFFNKWPSNEYQKLRIL